MDMTVVTREHANIAVIDTFPSEGNKAPTMALTAQTTTSTADLMTWHCHLGHLNADAVSQMTDRDMVTGMAVTKGSTLHTPCEPCVNVTIHQPIFPFCPPLDHPVRSPQYHVPSL